MIGLLRRLLFRREHRWTHQHLSDYLDRELDPGERERIEAHMSVCPQCRRVLATLRRTLEGLRGIGAPPTAGASASGIAERVIAGLRGEP
ncbi:MAG: anti-sigma factor family protein [Solirubrobacterales bacterium]